MQPVRRVIRASVFLCGLGIFSLSGSAQSNECGQEQYFHPDEARYQDALKRPHPEFIKMRKAARKGDPVEQRNLAVSYESGYLVGRCFSMATEWYGRAAKGGDELAQKWLERNGALLKLMQASECYGSSCNLGTEGLPQTMSLVSDPRGHFFADVTINGVTVRGLIDTGASSLALGAAMAEKMGISSAGGKAGAAQTANGTTSAISKRVPSIKIGVFTLDDMEVSILPNLDQPLIGMNVLQRLRLNSAGGQMSLSR